MDGSKLPITGPCPIDLDAIGFDRSQPRSHCSHCDKSVHILSNMTERDAKAFLKEHAGQKLCVSYARDARGRVRFKPEVNAPVVPLARLRRRRPATAAGLGLAAALAACTPHNPIHDQPAGELIPVEQVEQVEPCESTKTHAKPADPLRRVEGMIEPQPLAGAAVLPEPEMIEGAIAVEPESAAERGELAVLPKSG